MQGPKFYQHIITKICHFLSIFWRHASKSSLFQSIEDTYKEIEQSNKQWMNSTATTLNKAAVATAKDFYFCRMQEQVRLLKKEVSACEWNERHEQTKTEALSRFENIRPNFGPENIVDSYQQQLENVRFFYLY